MRSGRGDTETAFSAEPDDLASQPGDVPSRLVDVCADVGPDLDDRLMHLALDLIFQTEGSLGENLLNMRLHVARLGIDDLKLFLDAEGK